jgi:hypothetical protein
MKTSIVRASRDFSEMPFRATMDKLEVWEYGEETPARQEGRF